MPHPGSAPDTIYHTDDSISHSKAFRLGYKKASLFMLGMVVKDAGAKACIDCWEDTSSIL